MRKQNGMIIIVSAPSGAGKTSICDCVVKTDKNICYSISCTTRAPRKGEKHGREYFFVDEKTFKQMIKQKKFAEWAKVHNNYYGTPKSFLARTLQKGKDVLLDIDVQGAVKIKKQYKKALMIFVMTPSFKILEKRLLARNKDSLDVIKTRIGNAKKEMKYIKHYEYLVINDKLDKAAADTKAVICAERLSIKRREIIF